MFIRNVTTLGSLLLGLSLTFSAHASVKRYLVQFKSPATFRAMAQNVAASRNSVLGLAGRTQGSQVHLFNTNASVTQTLDEVQMMVIETDDLLAVQSLRTHPAVALVEEEMFHPAPQPISTGDAGQTVSVSPSTRTPVDMPWGIAAVRAPQAWAITKGAGARVMVLDTGIDKTHEALVTRIEATQNFTGGDPNDVTDSVGHGSHVSGTILADGLDGGLTGVAPEAKVLMGKVCSEQGCSSIAIAAGLNWALQQKVDVVNMSLGGMFLSDAEGKALVAAEAGGVMVIAASGNDGQPTVSFPGASATVLAVGAVDEKLAKADFSNWGPELGVMGPGVDVISSVPKGTGRGTTVQIDLDQKGLAAIKSLPMVGSPIAAPATNSLVFANLGKPEDFKAVNVKGKFALISRGGIPFKDKVANAIQAGAAGVLVYNNAVGLIHASITSDGTEVSVPAAMIEQATGEAAKAALAAGQTVQASLGVVKSDYADFEGTSMATPHVVGVAALVRAANKKLTPAQVRDLLKKTATALKPNDQNQMGAGIVNAEAAVARAMLPALPVLQIAN